MSYPLHSTPFMRRWGALRSSQDRLEQAKGTSPARSWMTRACICPKRGWEIAARFGLAPR